MSIGAVLERKLEAILFAHGDPVSIARLARTVGSSAEATGKALNALRERLTHTSGLRIIEKGGSVQMVTAKEHAKDVERIFRARKQEKLTHASLEVLAIVAYSGPVTREEIEHIRGVNSAYILRTLLMRGLIAERTSGNARAYEISLETMRHLGLKDPHDLPEWHTIQENVAKARKASP